VTGPGFGVLIIILMETAMITPPVDINLYVVQGLRSRGRIDDVIIGAAPFVIAEGQSRSPAWRRTPGI
jgi:TRAP-type C4-dicarboxylate transport system permease large subunit